MGSDSRLISVVIPCYNQSAFLADAIDSVCSQSYCPVEVIVVDDGSTDATAQIAARYPHVTYLHQENRGLSAARNTGLAASRGEFLVFLDADDRLLPDALRVGHDALNAHPECGFVSGHHHHIDRFGAVERAYPQEPMAHTDPYLALLMNNFIGMHAAVMYRKDVFDAVGGFDAGLSACEDYDLYLRIAHRFPIVRHDRIVAEYRHHDTNMSRDSTHMSKTVVAVLDAQRTRLSGRGERLNAYRTGVRNWVNYYGQEILRELADALDARNWAAARRLLVTLLRYTPFWISRLVKPMRRSS